MAKFRKKEKIRTTKISTASLPDIVFLLLFFFMVSATMKEKEDLVETDIPVAVNITSAEQKTLVKTLTIGNPKNSLHGTAHVISDGSKFIELHQVGQWVHEKRNEIPDYNKHKMIIVIKSDEGVKMGLIGDIQQELRKANAKKVIYKTREGSS